MDFGALHRQTTKALEEEPVPAGQVILVSQEGQEFEMPQMVAEKSQTLKEMIGDIGAGRKIYLNAIPSKTLEEIVNLLKALHKYQNLEDKALLDAFEKDVAITDPFILLAAANYLDIQPIMELAARLIARQEINKSKSRFYTVQQGPLSKETHDKLFKLFGNDKSRIIPFISRYFFLLSGKNFTDIPFDSYHYSIQDYLDYSPENSVPQMVKALYIDREASNHFNFRISLSSNINNLKGLNAIPEIKTSKELNIMYARSIAKIPENLFVDFDDLEHLSIESSNLQTIPINALKNVRNLKNLTINYSGIKEIPNNLSELKQLQKLDLNNNVIQTIPASVSSLSNLTVISLYKNKITVIPKEIAALKKLTRIDLPYNKITHIDQETINAIAQLPALKILNLLNNPLDDSTKKALRNTLDRKAFFLE
jgi:hypothetical protein